jgi:CelD/BcsL family acetyltransferase involved in cellulose biosynthesis
MIRTIIVREAAALAPHVPAWKALARDACEPNVFYEPEFLLPCLEELGSRMVVYVVLVFAGLGGETLVGLFPFCRTRMHKFVRIPELKAIQGGYVLLGTPLVHREHVGPALDYLLSVLDQRPEGLSLAELREFGADGAFARHLELQLAARGQPHLHDLRCRTRALFRRRASAEEFLDAGVGRRGRRKRLDQQRRQLEQQGRLAYRRLKRGDDAEPWVRSFLELEAAGWKGHEGGEPLVRTEAERRFFERMARRLHGEGRLLMHGLALDGRFIAQNCTLLGADRATAFVFRIAYDERFAKQSPGVQLELEMIRAYHEPSCDITTIDSCTHTAHPLYNLLWPERRKVGYMVIGAKRPWTRLLLTGMAAVQEANTVATRLRLSAASLSGRARACRSRPAPESDRRGGCTPG